MVQITKQTLKTLEEMLAEAKHYHCTACAAQCGASDGSWRWNGTTWEHQCGDPQAGYFPRERKPAHA